MYIVCILLFIFLYSGIFHYHFYKYQIITTIPKHIQQFLKTFYIHFL